MHRSIIPFIALALAHCGDGGEDSEEVLALRAPPARASDHGPIELGSSMETELSRAQAVHTWQLTLPAEAAVTLRTEASVAAQPGDRELDTVLVLQRIVDGQPRWLAQNDDVGRSRYSRIVRTLPAGSYQAQVHGYSSNVRGRFAFVTACVGAGCPLPEPGCFFGDTFSDLRSHATLRVASETWITTSAQLSELERTQVIVAVQQSSHTDVTTIEQALAVVDQQMVRRMELHDPGGSVYLAFEYGAGDNSYGAIFASGFPSVLASIHDGDLLACAPHP
ncbi:MAG TPA: hypothetical protein VFX59_00545 [Polyangiales bacterium]|nr:hypothetical protein [Polyangiales bacterium]